MAEIILHPNRPDYCRECIFYDEKNGGCKNKDYEQNSYKVICVWHYCKYKQKRDGKRGIKMRYRYYSTQRPIAPGTYPNTKDNPALLIRNFSGRMYIPEIRWNAWGYVEYGKPLAKEDADRYELLPARFS